MHSSAIHLMGIREEEHYHINILASSMCMSKCELVIPLLESDLVSICNILLLVRIQKVSEPKVSNPDVVWRFHQNIMSSQVPVD